jgi:hypothetical protein
MPAPDVSHAREITRGMHGDDVLDRKGSKVGHDAGVCTFTSLASPEALLGAPRG